jgi:hypothetical protein
MRAVILQPGYLPWIGFFDLFASCDLFVILDHVQYDKRSWRNRNRIRTNSEQGWQYLTVPVNTKGKYDQSIVDTFIDNSKDWASKHLKAIELNYRGSSHFDAYFPPIEKILTRKWERLLDLDLEIICFILNELDIKTRSIRSSTFDTSGKKMDLLLEICKKINADEYLNGDTGVKYLKSENFEREGIKLVYHNYKHPVYEQRFKGFISHLSIIDLLLNHGREKSRKIMNLT